MRIKRFTNEQVLLLRQNPYTYSVTQERLFFTKAFKEIFYSKYQTGELPRQILIDHGYDPEVLGNRRIWGISSSIREQYKKYGSFHEGSTSPQATKAIYQSSKAATSEKDVINHLQHEVNYLKQEIMFLKKISSTRTTRK